MSSNLVLLPYSYFADPDRGRPLFGGFVYVGEPDLDPESFPIDIFYIEEDGTEVPAPNPVPIGNGGIIIHNGKAVQIGVNQNYSMRVRDKNLNEKYNTPNNDVTGGATIGFVKDGFVFKHDTLADAVSDAELIDGATVNIKERTAGNGGGAIWDVVLTSSVTPNTFNIVQSTGDPTLSLVLRVNGGVVTTNQFGAYKDNTNTTETTAAIQAALDFAAANGISVEDEQGEYSITSLRVKDGVKRVDLNSGTLKPTNATVGSDLRDAVVILTGPNTGEASGVNNAEMGFNIDMSAGDRMAIVGDGTTKCRIRRCKIFGFTDSLTENHRGIRLADESSHNIIYHNDIIGVDDPVFRGLLIEIFGASTNPAAVFGGFFRGNIVRADKPCLYNIAIANNIFNGSYAFNIEFAEKNIIADNICKNNNHRAIYCANSAWNNVFDGNQLLSFRSAGVLLGYGSSFNVISNNIMKNEGAEGLSGEAAVNINTGSSDNLVTGNLIDAPMNYGVYIATDSSRNVVTGNKITNHYLAAIAVENDWIETRPGGAIFSRPNYGDPTILDPPFSTSWTYTGIEGNVISGNTINAGYQGRSTAGIYISQIVNTLAGATETQTRNTTVKGNTFPTVDNIGKLIYIFKDTGVMNGIRLTGNTFNDTANELDFGIVGASYYDVLSYINGNELLDDLIRREPIELVDGDTTPSIIDLLKTDHFAMTNTSPTSVTTFDDAKEGQIIRVRLNSFTTLIHNASVMRLKDNINLTGTSNVFISLQKLGSIWLEIDRNA